MLSPVPAPTSVPIPKRTPCSTWRTIGKMPEARNAFEDGQCATAVLDAARRRSSSSVTWTLCASTEHSLSSPARS